MMDSDLRSEMIAASDIENAPETASWGILQATRWQPRSKYCCLDPLNSCRIQGVTALFLSQTDVE